MAIKQENRLLSVATPLGEDVLVLVAFQGHEEISRLFSYQLDFISDKNDIAPADIVGKNVTFSVLLGDETPRYFNGHVSRFIAGDEQDGRRTYWAEVVPWYWFLTRKSDCRIFQNMTIPDIVEDVFGKLGFSDYDMSGVTGSHREWEYLVQYRETDFNFVSRIMEQEGLFYFFKHEDGKHTLMIADQKSAYVDCPENEAEYHAAKSEKLRVDQLTAWEHRYEFRTGKWAHTDYNFKTPTAKMMANTKTVVDLPDVDKYECYDYPGEYPDKGEGDTLVDFRMEEEEVGYETVHGSSTYRTYTPGGKFTIKKHPSSQEEGKSYVLTSVQHSASIGSEVGYDYENSFTCIPVELPFRPARITPKPIIQGHQTAVVVGPPGEEIYPDEFGRIKVQFHWDREGKKDDKSSCWIRVGQFWAGKQWGAIHIPRIGHEVMVSFLEGDPDRPIITGCVYNADNMPPYDLPDNKTQSGVKSRSSKGAGPDNYNEIRFEDKKGEEQLLIHAEKNQDIEVENDETHWVGRDRKKQVDQDERSQIKRDRTETVGRDETIIIENDRKTRVGKDETVIIEGERAEDVAKNENITIGEERTESVGKNETVTVNDNRQHNVGKNDQLTVGKELLITAGDQIALETGAASIIMKKNGDIQIKGKNIQIEASGKIIIDAGSDVSITGTAVKQN